MSSKPQERLFGTVERRLFRTTAVLFAILALLGLIAVLVWTLAQALAFFYKLVLPLCVAGILALVLYPVVDFLALRLRLPRIVSVALILGAFMGGLAACILLLLPIAAQQLLELGAAAPAILAGWEQYLDRRFPVLTEIIMARVEAANFVDIVPDMASTGQTLASYAGVLLGLGFVPLFLFFMLLSGGGVREQAAQILTVFSPATQKQALYFLDVFVGHVTAFFQGQLVIALIMGVMFATGFTLAGLEGGIVIGLMLGLLSIVPFLGTLTGLLIVLPMAYFQPDGGIRLLVLSLLVFASVQLLESWLLSPRIMAQRSGLHPAVVVISIFFWGTALGGVIGMILAVPLTAFIVAVWVQAKAGIARSMVSDRDADRIAVLPGAEIDTRAPRAAEGERNS